MRSFCEAKWTFATLIGVLPARKGPQLAVRQPPPSLVTGHHLGRDAQGIITPHHQVGDADGQFANGRVVAAVAEIDQTDKPIAVDQQVLVVRVTVDDLPWQPRKRFLDPTPVGECPGEKILLFRLFDQRDLALMLIGFGQIPPVRAMRGWMIEILHGDIEAGQRFAHTKHQII